MSATRRCLMTLRIPSLSASWMARRIAPDWKRGLPQRRFLLSETVSRRVQAMAMRHEEVMQQLNESSVDVASLGKELSALASVASMYRKLGSMEEEVISLQELMQEAKNAQDASMEQECMEEIERLQAAKLTMEERMIEAVLPRQDDDFESDAILEIRAGTGGDEAALFAADLLTAYTKTAKAKGWKFELLNESRTDLGGVKEAAVSIAGSASFRSSYEQDGEEIPDPLENLGPYGLFKFESGVHRVQRVPVNDNRIHTSACSVAVLPSAPEETTDLSALLPMSELKIETFRASGAGGQHVNTTESAVRITHLPTGITAAIQDERSQHKNKAKALKLVTARVRDRQRSEESRELGEARNSLMGGGDRSERIRTYNFPQDRVTDHRSKHSEHGLAKLLAGGPDDGLVVAFAPSMRVMQRDELIRNLNDS